jgi:meiotic recombination protein SPO11
VILVDCDPYGINILFHYRYGSSLQRSGSSIDVHWWGIKTDHILGIGKESLDEIAHPMNPRGGVESSQGSVSGTSVASTACRDPVTQLSMRDRKIAIGLLKQLDLIPSGDKVAAEMKTEIQTMLLLGVKTEIQWLDESGSISMWLDRELGGLFELNAGEDM